MQILDQHLSVGAAAATMDKKGNAAHLLVQGRWADFRPASTCWSSSSNYGQKSGQTLDQLLPVGPSDATMDKEIRHACSSQIQYLSNLSNLQTQPK